MSAGQEDYLFVRGVAHFNQFDSIQTSCDTSLSWNFFNVVHVNWWEYRRSHGSCVVCACVRVRFTNLL